MTTNAESNSSIVTSEGSNAGYVDDINRDLTQDNTLLHEKTDGRNNVGHVVDIDNLASLMARMLEDVPQYMCKRGHPGRISRIPQTLREVDVKSYEPYFMSIGPYHHDSPRVQRMEKRKLVVLKFVLEQTPELRLEDYLREISNIESAARSFYSDVEMEIEKFVRMLLLDSLYIVTVFCGMEESNNTITGSEIDKEEFEERDHHQNEDACFDDDSRMMVRDDESDNETSCGERWFRTMFSRDVFLLENQLPFFVLQKIFALAYGGTEAQLIDIMKHKVGMLLSEYMKLDSEKVIENTEEVHHLLHLCHLFFRPILEQESTKSQFLESSQMFRLGSAVQLYEAGVSFKARSCSTQHSLLDVTFSSSGKLVIPALNVDDKIAPLLRNLIALEQMKYPSLGLHVSAYAVLLLHLITTPEDVKLLRRKGIIQHHLASDKEMMYLVNKLSVGLSFDYSEDRYSLKPVFQELRRYSLRRVPGWRAWMKHRYLTNPWTIIYLLVASLLLFLSGIQTYYAV